MKEEWKDIEGFDGFYQVSNHGRIRSYKTLGNSKRLRTPKMLALNDNKYGYLKTSLWKNSNRTVVKVHRLVAKYFIPNPKDKYCVNHIDGDKRNNHVDNLEWVSQSKNIKHAFKNGLMNPAKGESINKAKLTEQEVLEIRAAHNLDCFTQQELASGYDVARSTIRAIINRRTWKHI